ncbi:unnamed protein product (macronuclear) [Paramecium tetraurelia]|uniref:UBC core domain-containing protein n=1 Tax=Paramecium tetraurelia TaxID=5888 RepID=A0DAS7_PARTE|nr:uncharacterized protein GSPATT00015051001 [Paramecium tetraurelia]CAK80144.1 unnamed protein product [Paramecium tetraurelia]|eukprot:XP_001447541.1 hypothetical protein (macronuclear) [Paramecium tetraurelia strain d4-2]
MINQGRSNDAAVFRALLNTQAQIFCYQVIAEGTQYHQEGNYSRRGSSCQTPITKPLFMACKYQRPSGIFHLELIIPSKYPYELPQVRTFIQLPHPNLTLNSICLDILQPRNPEDKQQKDLSSDYTIQTLLLWLQAFLFQELKRTDNYLKLLTETKQAVIVANNFKCSDKDCKHNAKESKIEYYINTQPEQQLLEQQFICYNNTKLSYKKTII